MDQFVGNMGIRVGVKGAGMTNDPDRPEGKKLNSAGARHSVRVKSVQQLAIIFGLSGLAWGAVLPVPGWIVGTIAAIVGAMWGGVMPKPLDSKTPVHTIGSLLLVSGTITWLVTLIF